MSPAVTFTHLLNPFPAKPGSEHAVASRVTWATLRNAHSFARQQGVEVNCRAVVMPGDEIAVEPPCTTTVYLERTVEHVASLRPKRPLPLIGDLLKLGARGDLSSHIIFSNMDISVQPHFYTSLHRLVAALGPETPFTLARTNIDASLANSSLEQMYAANGTLGEGYDCFVIPRQYIEQLDLGDSCIGAPHFDLLLYMALDVLSDHRVKSLNDERLTFHLGNDIAWAAMMDYVEHNLRQALDAIQRMKQRYPIRDGSAFNRIDRRHFQRNARFSSAMLRKVRRIPGLSSLILKAKRALGRQY